MPLYECHCQRCELTFEALAPLSAAGAPSHPCPDCGEPARRILSAVVFGRSGASVSKPEQLPSSNPSRPDVTRLRVPPPAQLCWMDGPSKSRYAAYLNGRGKEFDETVAARAEGAKNRDPAPAPSSTAATAGEHTHSPLANPEVYARRRAAALKSKPEPSAD